MNKPAFLPKISVIINTDGRAKPLATCLESLQYLKYPNFEVVVVAGPTRDGTHELCQSYGDRIVYADCPVRNLSMSRNISIHICSGEIVGFLDDDSIPEPEWLDDVVPAFEDPNVGVAGGFLHDHTGKTYQWKFGTLNRYATADTSWTRAAPEFNFPYSFHYPHVMANSLFRRSAIVEAGGFDEEYEYFLDESDLILRFVDLGWKVAQLDKGFIHHKFMPSHIRNESRVLTSWYSLVKNKTYFSLINNCGHSTVDDVLKEVQTLIQDFRGHVNWAIAEKILQPDHLIRFEDEVDRALREGLSRGLENRRRLIPAEDLKGQDAFRPYPTLTTADQQKCFVFLTKTYPPESVGGIGRYIHQLAEEIAKLGHQVHVLTQGRDHDRVDFENGVWVHRICVVDSVPPAELNIPAHIWSYSNTMYEEALEIASRRSVDCVYAPIWDAEGIAFLHRRKFKLVTSLQTTLHFYLESNPDKAADANFLESFANPMLEIERRLMLESDGVHSISHSIAVEIERAYKLAFNRDRLSTVPLGMVDWIDREAELPTPIPQDVVRVCFIGRLESRKGADVFLSIVPDLLRENNNIHIDVVGNDQIRNEKGETYRGLFESTYPELVGNPRLIFHGEVNESRLRGFYMGADIVVAPSRFESFGLVHLEAMMYGRAVIGCNIGGMQEVISNEETGLLASPGDPQSLKKCVSRLLNDPKLRKTLGENARNAYLRQFHVTRMATDVIGHLEQVSTTL